MLSLAFVQCSKDDGFKEETRLDLKEDSPILLKAGASSELGISGSIASSLTWNDTNGNHINAHGGGMYYENGYYYWYGEDASGWRYYGIHCYRSSDLINWTNMGVVMPIDPNDNTSDIRWGCILQRPKVVYNSSTGKYVAFFKLYPNGTYQTCYIGVATADSPTGPFTYSNKFLGASNTGSKPGTGDFALYQDGSSLYMLGVARGETGRPSKFVQMRNDYKWPLNGGWTAMSGVQNNTEGHAIFKRGNRFHLIGSGSSGWDPYAVRYFTSTSLAGPWTNEGNPCSGINSITGEGANIAYGGQSTYITEIQGADNQYMLMMDVWEPGDLGNSDYIWLPFTVNSSTNELSVNWVSTWNLSWFGGGSIVSGNIYNLRSVMSDKNLDNFGSTSDGDQMGQWTPNSGNNQKWKIISKGGGYYKLISETSGKALANGNVNTQGAPVNQWTDNNNDPQTWKIVNVGGNKYTLENKMSGKYLDNGNVSTNTQSIVQWSYSGNTTQQWIID